MSLKSVKTLTASQIAKKWKLSQKTVNSLIDAGSKVEHEHDKDMKNAKEIARDHISERPDYYKKLRKMEKTKISMKEGLSTEPERDSETIGDYTGASRKVMKVDEVRLPKVSKNVKNKLGKAGRIGATFATVMSGATAYDNASRNVGSPIKDVAAVATGVPGKVGWSITPGHYALKGLQKAKEHIKSKQKQMKEQGSPANPARYTERPMYEESHADKKYGFKHPETGKLIGRVVPSYGGKFTTRRVKTGMTASVRKTHKSREEAEQHLIKHADSTQINEISAELVGKVSNARFWRKEAPSKTLTRAINKKFIESGKKKEPKKPVKEETTMDTKDLINEALDDILENNLVSMKENLMAALQEKAMEKIEEKKKDIAANYFAQ